MIKVWHEECKGKGIIERHGHYLQECTNCNGKGYTEHEGSLENLELAEAVKAWLNSGETISSMGANEFEDIDIENEAQLLVWYREQTGGNHA